MSALLHRLVWLSFALLLSSCMTARKDSLAVASCCSPLPLSKIGKDLGFEMEDLGMHQYHFFNAHCEFDLLASSDTIHLVDESSDKSSGFSPLWTLSGDITEQTLKSKLRTYLCGNKAEQNAGGNGS
ncbi:hypothetical protein [Prosthecobacter sp.]|uniref:hypothetical protein n=1 Tax=Prosthecobacter sp. TaxID=1965333 RepID=UPI001D36FB09|nr:hypothetical protein [Prosthecobacter sp.]MCB1276909.1 hypothetical protein [Prosthecobacter sp.]